MVTSSCLFNLAGNPFSQDVLFREMGTRFIKGRFQLKSKPRGRWPMFNSSLVSSLACIPYRSTWSSSATSLQLWSMFDLFWLQVCGIVVVPHYHPIIAKSNPYWTIFGNMKVVECGFQSSAAEESQARVCKWDDSLAYWSLMEARFCPYTHKIWITYRADFGCLLVLKSQKYSNVIPVPFCVHSDKIFHCLVTFCRRKNILQEQEIIV
jgi:hypothetical protein